MVGGLWIGVTFAPTVPKQGSDAFVQAYTNNCKFKVEVIPYLLTAYFIQS